MTYSIVACDPEKKMMGVAVQTALPFVGTLCPWAEAGVGVVATQALVRTSHGPNGLALMRGTHTAPEALAAVLAADADRDVRQVAMLDVNGQVAAHTGKHTIRESGHKIGENYSMQANMMAPNTVWEAMAETFEATRGHLALRIMAALDAAQKEGGDFRGQQSAALKIVSMERPTNADSWQGVLYDIRVDDHVHPVEEMRRLVAKKMAYDMADEAEGLASKGDFDKAISLFQDSVAIAPDEDQLRFWFPLTMADEYGQLARVDSYLRELFQKDKKWVLTLEAVVEARPLKTEGLLEQLRLLAKK